MTRTFSTMVFALCMVVAGIGNAVAAESPREVYSFAVVPQQAASKIARQWSPILRYLSEKSGVELKLKTAPDIPAFEERLAAAEYDIAYMNPYHYVAFSKTPGYQAFAMQKNAPIVGILVASKANSVNSLSELNGKELVFPSPAAFAASILPRAYLRREGISFTPIYVSSHDSVYQNVARGYYPAGGGIDRTLNVVDVSVREKLEVIWRSPEYTSHAFAFHPRVPKETIRRLQEAMTKMGDDPAGRALLTEIHFEGFAPAADRDWDDVRALNIDVLDMASPAGGN